MDSKAKTIGYWVTTGLAATIFLVGGVSNLMHAPAVAATMTTLGYPTYVETILGAWKLLGAVTILAPRLPRLKEWAYAGMFFDLTGAAASHAMAGDVASKVVIPLVILVLVAASWALRPSSRTLAVIS